MRLAALPLLLLVTACERAQPDPAATEPVSAPSPDAPPAPDTPDRAITDPAPSRQAPADTATRPDSPTRIPAAFVGRYAGRASDCGRSHELELTIAPESLTFWESVGEVVDVRAAGDRAVDVGGRFSGEGESWTRTHRLTLDAAGARLTMTGNGASVTRVRCG